MSVVPPHPYNVLYYAGPQFPEQFFHFEDAEFYFRWNLGVREIKDLAQDINEQWNYHCPERCRAWQWWLALYDTFLATWGDDRIPPDIAAVSEDASQGLADQGY